MITEFDALNLKPLRVEIEAALKQVADKHSIKLSLGSFTYQSDSFTVRLTGGAGASVEETTKETKWRKDFITMCGYVNLSMGDLGKQVTLSGKAFVIAGMRPAAKLSIVIRSGDGKYQAASVESVKAALNSQPLKERENLNV
ncbi:MAG: hypothetical protein QFB87_05620 [Patescibacteria group bacterium]|nr:hypothetical protein [Patescibacteria group bacterium]